MRLVLAPIIERATELGIVRVPALPDDVVWSQASSLWDSEAGGFQQLVLADIDDAMALSWAKGGLVVLDEALDLAALGAAMREPHDDLQAVMDLKDAAILARGTLDEKDARSRFWDAFEVISDAGKSRRDEYVEIYRDAACRFEQEWFGVKPGIVALATLHTDNFNRSNRNLSGGDAMSDALGTWATGGTPCTIVSNEATTGTGAPSISYDSAMSAVATQRVTATRRTAVVGLGVVFRYANDSNFYLAHYNPSIAKTQLYKNVSNSLTQLGSDGSSLASGDLISGDADTTTISLLKNGTSDIAVTDSALASGVAGIRFSTTGSTVDDWSVSVPAAILVSAWKGLGQPVRVPTLRQV